MDWIYNLKTKFKLFMHAHISCTDTPYLRAIHTLNVRMDTACYLRRHVPSETFEFESNHIRGVMYAKINSGCT